MPRRARIEVEGGIHHVTVRGNRKEAIFLDDVDRRSLLRHLPIVADRYRWTWLSYCLMTNHAHFVIETPEATLGVGMRELARHHAQTFNQRHGENGHLFQGRYGSVLARTDEQFAQLLRYVARNPVKAGLCADPSDWRWSSHRSMVSDRSETARAKARVETLLEGWGGAHGSRYVQLFDANGRLALRYGDESPWTYRPPLDEFLASGDLDDAMRAARAHGYRLAEIARAVGLHESTVSRRTRRGA